MNVQHVESLNDVVAKITSIIVRETVPDSVLERAHELKLVDLPPDDLLERLREGKVYVPAQAQRAIENFFKKGNLIALRELALRRTAEHVDAQMREFRRAQGIEQTWAAADKLVVLVSPSPYSASLVRAARRMAGALHARWFAVYVTPRAGLRLSSPDEARLSKNLRLAEQLGADVVTLSGDRPADEILQFARENNVTKLIVGKPVVRSLRDRFRSSLVDELVREGGDIDVFVTAGDRGPEDAAPPTRSSKPLDLPSYVAAVAASAVATGAAYWLFGTDQLPDVVMAYLLGIMLVSSRYGFGPSIVAALSSVAAFDFFFVPPFLTFDVSDFKHTVTFVVMFLVAIVVSALTQRIRSQAEAARHREARTRALYELSRGLAVAQGLTSVVEVAASHLEKVFASQVSVFAPTTVGVLSSIYTSANLGQIAERDTSVAQWVWSNRHEAGLGTATLPGSRGLYLPLSASGGLVGVLGLFPEDPARFGVVEKRRQVEAFAAQMALAMERAVLAEETSRARREVETEQLRSSLLSSVSHDLRTPLAVITGAASTIVEGKSLDEATHQDLMKTIIDEAERLNRLIRNLLDMTRLESGAIHVKKDWLPVEEVVGSALNRLDARLAGREIRVELPPELPLVPLDPILVELVLINLLENAAKYSDGAIEISSAVVSGEVIIEVADHGPGIPPGDEARIFDKFHRSVHEGTPGGVGLGLAICRAIVAAHGGRIWARNRAEGGASFQIALPIRGEAPKLELSEPAERSVEAQP